MSETKRNSFKLVRTLYTVLPMILIQLLLLLLQLRGTASAKNTIALPGCPESCGGIPIPYPFGIGPNCTLSQEFNIACKISFHNLYNNTNPFLGTNSKVEILNISLSLGQARTKNVISSQCYPEDSHRYPENNHVLYHSALKAPCHTPGQPAAHLCARR